MVGSSEIVRTDSYTKLHPTSSPSTDDYSESKKSPPRPSSDDFEYTSTLVPSSLKFPALKFEAVDEEADIQSPERSLWEYFADQLEAGDYMISSPVRSSSTSQPSNYYCNYSPMRCSPPRSLNLPPPNYSTNKGKGLSPLHRVFTSPNNHYMQVESLSLPALEFLDDLDKADADDDFCASSFSAIKAASSDVGIGSSSDCFDLSAVPELLDCLTIPNSNSTSRGFSADSSSVHGGSQLILEGDLYQLTSTDSPPLLEQLQQERHQEQQQQHPQNMINSSLMVPLSLGPDQVKGSSDFYFYFSPKSQSLNLIWRFQFLSSNV